MARPPGGVLDAASLTEYCQRNRAAHMVPRFLEFVDEMPRAPTSRIEKYKLRQRAEADRSRLGDRLAYRRS